jgi:glycosyltransferase involved in cell wall biosynthesis
MPTPTWAAHFGRQWGTEVRVLPNGFDAAIPHADAPEGRPVIAHLGTYYPGRQSLRPLWSRLRALADRDPSAAPIVRFIGELPAAARTELDDAGIGDLVEVTGLVGHDEALRLVASATALIAAGAVGRDPIARGWVPAKLFEYLASDRPILYLSDPAGDASTMLQAAGGCQVIDPADEEALEGALTAALEGSRQARAIEGMSRRERTRDLASLFDQLPAPRPL